MSTVSFPIASPVRASLPVISIAATENPRGGWWVSPVKWTALGIFAAIPIFSLLWPRLAGRVVWTVVVAAIPLFIVLVGYHRWREICPLAFFAKLAGSLRVPGRRRVPQRSELTYYYVAFAIFFLSLWLRLIATNGDGVALALFLVSLLLVALVSGAIYTGKTWCNYFCPLSFIEKIYTEPRGLRATSNSQCPKCTACKKSCPDISEENGYWKEISSESRRRIYFAFPGLVLGFYFYYFLQAGTWDYYFSGSWTNEPRLWRSAMLPGINAATAGFFFLPQLPRAVASFLTLGLFALLGLAVFSLLEFAVSSYQRKRDPQSDVASARHIVLTLAAFSAFVIFYTFAGAPTLRKLPWVFPHIFLVIVVLTATLFLVRRLKRTQSDFAEEVLGQSILKRWQWADTEPPKDLREALLVHQLRTQEKSRGALQIVNIYREAVREVLADGFVTREEIDLLEGLRNRLQIKDADHETVMLALAEEESAMLRDSLQHMSSEKRLQLETYSCALGAYFERSLAADGKEEELVIRQLRDEYRVTETEHAAVLRRVMGDADGLALQLAEEVKRIGSAATVIRFLEGTVSPSHELLADLLRQTRTRSIGRLLRALSCAPVAEGRVERLGEALASGEGELRTAALKELCVNVPVPVAERVMAAAGTQFSKAILTPGTELHECLESTDPCVRAAALFALFENGAAGPELLQSKCQDESQFVRETVHDLLLKGDHANKGNQTAQPMLTLEKMIALRSSSIFQQLPPESLRALAHASRAEAFPAGAVLCTEGEQGSDVFILLDGDVKLFKHESGRERFVSKEGAGGLIGEMAILDPAPRAATVIAGDAGVRVLRLDGVAFSDTLSRHSSISSGVIRILAQRLRAIQN
ncbi:MAG: cyclic nucleotide-binding domain-containing protein [Pyrinomonadaceae bacterium]|nr:cyclic nucleotide-binding domain-containing protein [Pyrinomonadaceae bacterium]